MGLIDQLFDFITLVAWIFFIISCLSYFFLITTVALISFWLIGKCNTCRLWLYRFFEVFETASVVLGGNKTALNFMRSKNTELGMKRPINMLNNDDDAIKVINILWKNFREKL